jgi:fibronectin type 3 domain-containing protein
VAIETLFYSNCQSIVDSSLDRSVNALRSHPAMPGEANIVISLGWTASGTRGIAQYRVFRSQTPGAGYELVGTTVNTDFIDTLVRPGVQYYYVVQTIDIYGALAVQQ